MKKLRESSIINMFGSSPYLYMGKDRIYHQNYNNPSAEDNETYDELLEMADEAQSKMISGVIKVLEKEGKEVDLSNINRYLKKYSEKIWDTYVFTFR
jgi:chromosome condensin MukBEF MukE localization factor